jgi:hypothetical protein
MGAGGCWHYATVSLAEPSAPVRARDVADVRDRLATELRRSRHSPTRRDELALAVRAVAHDGGHLVREDAREQRQIAGAVVSGASLTLGEAVKVAAAR